MLRIFKITAFLMLLSISGYAQTAIKIAHVSTDSVLISLPEFPDVSKQLESFNKQLSAQLTQKQKEYTEKGQKLEKEKDDLLPLILEERIKELKQLEERIFEFQKTAQKATQQKRTQLFTPLMVKIQQEINKVSKEKGYNFVYPLESFLYVSKEHDLTGIIIKNLGGTVK